MKALVLRLLAAAPGTPCSLGELQADSAWQLLQGAKRVRSWCDTCSPVAKPAEIRVAGAAKRSAGKAWQLTLRGKVLDATSAWLTLADGSERRLSLLIACEVKPLRETRGAPPRQLCGDGSAAIERLVSQRVVTVPAALEYVGVEPLAGSTAATWRARDGRSALSVTRAPNLNGHGPVHATSGTGTSREASGRQRSTRSCTSSGCPSGFARPAPRPPSSC